MTESDAEPVSPGLASRDQFQPSAQQANPVRSSAALNRLQAVLAKAYSIALLATWIELAANALSQNVQDSLPQLLIFVLITTVTAGAVVSGWFFGHSPRWLIAHALSIAAAVALWPVISETSFASDQFAPWPWWGVGIASLSAILAMRPIWSSVFTVLNPLIWFLVRQLPSAGELTALKAAEESVYVLLLSAVLAGLLWMMRSGAIRTDNASAAAIASAVERARVDAVERERQQLDALVHDRVLNTLLVAANASSAETRAAAADLAAQAIESLTVAAGASGSVGQVTTQGLFRALSKAAVRLAPRTTVTIKSSVSFALPEDVAVALTEATLQSIDNALRHSGSREVDLEMIASDDPLNLKILVSDRGKGFRVTRVSKNRIGLNVSIIGRVRSVGGFVRVESEPGVGTKIDMSWGPG